MEGVKKDYGKDFYIFDICINSIDYWKYNPSEEFDMFWEKLIFPTEGELEDHVQFG